MYTFICFGSVNSYFILLPAFVYYASNNNILSHLFCLIAVNLSLPIFLHIYIHYLALPASPGTSPPSVTSGLKVSVQAAKPASYIRLLYKELPNVYVFFAHKMFTTFCAPFPN